MLLTGKLLAELQKRLKIGNRRGVHLNAIPANSRYKFDLNRLSHIDEGLPAKFINALLSEQPLKFKVTWKGNVPDLSALPKEEQSHLVKITKAFEELINQTEAIESEKGINTFGFGFPILARRDTADNKLAVAPVLIWSLRIRPTREFNTWEILRNEDDPIYINEVLVNHLQSELSVEIEPIPGEMLDDGLISKEELVEICAKLVRTLNTTSPEDLAGTFRQQLERVAPIGDKAHYERLLANSANAFIEFAGLFSIFEVQKQNIIDDYDGLMALTAADLPLDDLAGHSFQPISSVETDPSQQSILHALETARNILIQGPPGTGKSQTLTAVLINALENNKRTIVVCEKRTALEVLHSALAEKGLDTHCVLIRDIVKDRRAVVDSVRGRIDNAEYRRQRYTYSKTPLDNIVRKAEALITSINARHRKLAQPLLGGKSWTDVVGDLLAELKTNADDCALSIGKHAFTYSAQELSGLLDLVRKGQPLYADFLPIENMSFLNPRKLAGDNPYAIEQAIHDDFDCYAKQLEQMRALEEVVRGEYVALRQDELNQQIEAARQMKARIDAVWDTARDEPDFADEAKIAGFGYLLQSLFSKAKKQNRANYLALQGDFLKLENHLKRAKDLDAFAFTGKLEARHNSLASVMAGMDGVKSGFDAKIQSEFQQMNLLGVNPGTLALKSLPALQKAAGDLQAKANADGWQKDALKATDFRALVNAVEAAINAKRGYFNADKDLFTVEFRWLQFYNGLSEPERTVVDALKAKADWRKTFLIFYLNALLVSTATTELPTNDEEHQQLEAALGDIGKKQLKFIRDFWFSKQIDAAREFEQKHNGVTVENLYNKRSSHRFKRLSLRQMVQADPGLFSTFFPVILTSPDVASNLFKGMNRYFDIVMFDEASQLRIEDNLPAILKGKQVVIAGDEHQMPPSNYFSKVFDGAVEDEDDLDEEEPDQVKIDKDDILLSCESLLDFGLELKFTKQHLDFHYRSRHPYLIDFSNHAFYNQRLSPLPSTFDYVPVKYIPVNGIFVDHANEAEADSVLSILEKNIHRLPSGKYPSVGIATFNIAQRNLIKGKILNRQKSPAYADFNAKIQEMEENGLFVKNLENIQGDERDVIILSTTYGPGKDGKFAQRFGPINHSKGYKLLNVIVTRAKYKVYCCTSIPEQVFLGYKEHLAAEGANNKRAVLYAYLAYCKATSGSDDASRQAVLAALAENASAMAALGPGDAEKHAAPFEAEVYRGLAAHLGADKLTPHLQFAGFKIDVAYDPQTRGVPKVAIECDGAKHHSCREAYLYDLHRKKMLENYGFVFHRVWSTNWWRNPGREAARLADFIRSVETTPSRKLKDLSPTAAAFTDDI